MSFEHWYYRESIFGTTNQTGLAVRFSGQELLTAPANGQARIDAADNLFTYLMIDLPNGLFGSLILNPDATVNGTVDFTATTILGGVTRTKPSITSR